jgi:DUF2075 family protein
MKLQASHHGRDGRHQAPPAVQTWPYRLDKAASYDSNLGNAELELDFVGLCWGGDLIWRDDGWLPRKMSAPRWQVLRDDEKRRFRLNAYRVLLTRSRAGTVIFVPSGSEDDPTRSPSELDETAGAFLTFGCATLT